MKIGGFEFKKPEWLKPTAWDELPMEKKAEMMRVCINNGITDLQDIRTAYNRHAAGEDIYGEGGITHPSEFQAEAEAFGRYLANGGSLAHRYDGTSEDTQYIDKVGQPYYDYNLPDHPLTQNVIMKDVTITPERYLSPEERNYRERLRQRYLRDYDEYKDKEQTNIFLQMAQNDWNNSVQKKALGYGIEAVQGIGMASDITGTLFGGIPVYSGMKGARALDRATHTGNAMDYVDAGIWLSPMLTVAGKKVYDAAKPVVKSSIDEISTAWALRNPELPEGFISFSPKAQTSSIMNSSSSRVPFFQWGNDTRFKVQPTEKAYANLAIQLNEAKEYKNSEGYKNLVDRFASEIEGGDIGTFSRNLFDVNHKKISKLTLSNREPGSLGEYDPVTNSMDLDLAQIGDIKVPYHEGIHWQRVGTPDNIGPKFKAWREARNTGKPKEVENKLFMDFYNSEEYNRYLQKRKADTLLDEKVEEALYPFAGETLRKPGELQAYGLEAGKAIGIKPFTEYPGVPEAAKAIKEARIYDPHLNDVKSGGEQNLRRFWDILTGNYIPSTLIGTFGINKIVEE